MPHSASDPDTDEERVVDGEASDEDPWSSDDDDEEVVVEDEPDEKETAEAIACRLKAHVNRVMIMHQTVLGKHFLSDQDDRKGEEEEDGLALDAYGAFDADDEGAARMQLLAQAVREELDKEWGYDPQYGLTYEDERIVGEQSGRNQVTDVTKPLVYARNPPPACEVCFCCRKKPASSYQTPEDVFRQAADIDPGLGIECVKEMAQLLLAGNNVEVRRRTACCRTVDCMLAQKVLKYECYEAWVISTTSRMQLERGTDRKDQGLEFSENIIFLRTLAVMTPCPLTDEELFALFQWLVLHSQWIQEREKRFIATGMAVVDNSHRFGYTFAKKQRFLDRMGSFVRRYALTIIFPHILDMDLSWYRWRSTANVLVETGMPKAPDVVYALMCEDNWEAWGMPRDADGRYEHRVPRGNPNSAKLFTREGFEESLTGVTHHKTGRFNRKTGKEILAAVEYRLQFASEAEAGSSATTGVAGGKKRGEAARLHKKIAGSHRKLFTVGHAATGPPTCGSAQANSGVHPEDRNVNAWRAMDHTLEEAKAMTSMYMENHKNGNTVGHEKQSANKELAKACTVLRTITHYVPPPVKELNATRTKYKCTDQWLAVRRTKQKA